MIPPINAISYGMYNPYGMGMYGMGMMGAPQTMEQLGNMRKAQASIYTDQISFAGKINPFMSRFNNAENINNIKALNNHRLNMNTIFNPYSSQNLGATKSFMEASSDLQKSMMLNPFSVSGLGLMC